MCVNDIFQAWVEWRNQLQQRISLHQRMHVLIWNHQVRSLRRCWNGWTLYVELRKTKKRNKGIMHHTCYIVYILAGLYNAYTVVIYSLVVINIQVTGDIYLASFEIVAWL